MGGGSSEADEQDEELISVREFLSTYAGERFVPPTKDVCRELSDDCVRPPLNVSGTSTTPCPLPPAAALPSLNVINRDEGTDWLADMEDLFEYALAILEENLDIIAWLTCLVYGSSLADCIGKWARGERGRFVLTTGRGDLITCSKTNNACAAFFPKTIYVNVDPGDDPPGDDPIWFDFVDPWIDAKAAGNTDRMYCLAVSFSSLLLHEILHRCAPLKSMSDTAEVGSCDRTYLVQNSYLWSMGQRYPCLQSTGCCSEFANDRLWMRDGSVEKCEDGWSEAYGIAEDLFAASGGDPHLFVEGWSERWFELISKEHETLITWGEAESAFTRAEGEPWAFTAAIGAFLAEDLPGVGVTDPLLSGREAGAAFEAAGGDGGEFAEAIGEILADQLPGIEPASIGLTDAELLALYEQAGGDPDLFVQLVLQAVLGEVFG